MLAASPLAQTHEVNFTAVSANVKEPGLFVLKSYIQIFARNMYMWFHSHLRLPLYYLL